MYRILLLTLLAAPAAQAETLRLPSPAASESLGPSLTVDAGGQVLLSWLQRDAGGHALRFSRLQGDTFSAPITIASGSDWFVNWADFPAIGALPSGALLAHWLQKSGPGRYAYDVLVSRSDDGGATWSDPLTPHRDGTETEHGFVSHFAWSEDLAGLVWLDGRETDAGAGHDHHGHGGVMSLRGAALAADGSLSREALLDPQVCDCCQTGAALATKGPVVVYRGRDAGEVRDIMIVRWTGTAWSAPTPVHRDGWVMPACPVNGPQVVARGDDVVVAWFTMADGHARVLIARSLDGGACFAPPRLVADGGVLGRVGLAQAADGRRWLAWMDEAEGDARLLLARFDADLEERDRQVVARLPRGRISGFPRLVHSAADGLVIAWTEAPTGRPQVVVARVATDL
ncbi:MAG TPA: sialidase family protein [Xanthomonadaceae bacterium]|nr:sialidase family protein [Xanthomonadaceae bacterium]